MHKEAYKSISKPPQNSVFFWDLSQGVAIAMQITRGPEQNGPVLTPDRVAAACQVGLRSNSGLNRLALSKAHLRQAERPRVVVGYVF